jgi:hypothetical protein
MIQESDNKVMRTFFDATRRIMVEESTRLRRIEHQASGWRWFGDSPEEDRLRRVCDWAVNTKAGPSRAYPAEPREPLPVSRRVVRGAPAPVPAPPRTPWPLPRRAPKPPTQEHRVALYLALRGPVVRAEVVAAVGHDRVDTAIKWAERRVVGLVAP